MQILFVAAEASPLIKTGGLGDVIGSLPKALQKEKLDVRVVIPGYKDIPAELMDEAVEVESFNVPLSWRNQPCILRQMKYNNIPFYFIHNDYYFNRQGIYGHYDDAERFAFFSKAVLEALPYMNFKPDIIHCNDWHTALVSTYLKAEYSQKDFYKNIKSVFTIHNMCYQGVFPKNILDDVLGLGWEYFTPDGLEFYDQVNYFKAGLNHSDVLTTVSPSYAKEIQTPDFGERLDTLLKKQNEKLLGILNGIDYEEFNPAKDIFIYDNYSKSLKSKYKNKQKLQQKLGLEVAVEKPLVAIVSRLVQQKGLDLVRDALDEIMNLDIQLVILGTGEQVYEKCFSDLAARYPQRVSANIIFDEIMARQVYAASDIFLMPSLFEPCGISQLIAMRYGSIPVVRETGGLRDSVKPYDAQLKEGWGFTFQDYAPHALYSSLARAVEVFGDKKQWNQIVKNALSRDFSWRKSAKEYVALYNRLAMG